MANLPPIITIDGPSGTGKGTVCGFLTEQLGWHLLDSGALYRVTAHAAQEKSVPFDDAAALASVAYDLNLRFEYSKETASVLVFLDDEDVSSSIRTETCGAAASQVAAIPQVRAALFERQKAFRQTPGLIADGRDMGTVVFPDAELKIFMTASAEERAKRRYKQLLDKGHSANLRQLSAEIAERDARDKERTVSPLKPADDAVLIDTTELPIQEVTSQIMQLVQERLSAYL